MWIFFLGYGKRFWVDKVNIQMADNPLREATFGPFATMDNSSVFSGNERPIAEHVLPHQRLNKMIFEPALRRSGRSEPNGQRVGESFTRDAVYSGFRRRSHHFVLLFAKLPHDPGPNKACTANYYDFHNSPFRCFGHGNPPPVLTLTANMDGMPPSHKRCALPANSPRDCARHLVN